MDEAMSSSPDPLSNSFTYYSPAKPRRPPRARGSLPLQRSSPKKQTFELDVGKSLSPQKIRVTVEAGESDAENAYLDFNGTSASPTRMPKHRMREKTTTTKIPLKGLSESEGEAPKAVTPKRGRGRPRKSIGTPVPAKKPGRASTPIQKNRRKSIGSLVDGDVEIRKRKGRSESRSRSRKGTRNSPPAAKDSTAASKPSSRVVSKKDKGRRKAQEPEDDEVLEDGSCENNVQDQEQDSGQYENEGALEPLDPYSPSRASPFYTVRSTTAIEGTGSDVLIARFDPGDETPQRAGWSSPHVIEAPQPSSSRRRANSSPSPSVSPARSAFDDRGVASPDSERRMSTESDHHGFEDILYDREDVEEDQYRDFDTILESEGFSMISVDSVPSLREHFSSPANRPEQQQPSPVGNKSLPAVREEESAYDDSFSAMPETVHEVVTPGGKPQDPRLLSVQQARADDSFSSIPAEAPHAVTPARKSQVSKLIPHSTAGNDSFSSVASGVLEAATPHQNFPHKRLSAAYLDRYKDSMSTVPKDVLDVATPAAVCQTRPSSDRLNVPVSRLNASSSRTQASSPALTRLLTPEETPSPLTEESTDHRPGSSSKSSSQAAGQASVQVSEQDSSMAHSHLPSSPPSIAPRRYTYTAHIRQNCHLNTSMTQTPLIVFSSPALPPPIQIGRGMPALAPPSEQAERPVLSPIVRAGRMLQDILVPSSPRSRSQSLGSPFKSPAADKRSSSIIAQGTSPSPVQGELAGSLPRLDLSGHLGESSSQRHSRSSQQEDPFRNSAATKLRSRSPEEKQQYSLELPQQRRYSDPRLLDARSGGGTVHSDDAMSWQVEEEIPIPGDGTSSRNNIDLFSNLRVSSAPELSGEQRWEAERAAVVQAAANANTSKVIAIDSEDEHSKDGQGDDEDFGLLLETLNSSSPVIERREAPNEIFERPRRSKLPSPWRKNSKRLVYSDELSQMPSCPPEVTAPTVKSLGIQMTAKSITSRRVIPQELCDDMSVDLSDYQIPQKANFDPRPRETGNLDLSALFGTSPPNALSTLSSGPQKSMFQRKPRPTQALQGEFPAEKSSSKRDGQKGNQPVGFQRIPQKMGFNPQPRASSSDARVSSTVPVLFGGSAKPNQTIKNPEPESSSPVCIPLMNSSPSRMNSTQATRPSSAVEMSPSDCSFDSKSSNADTKIQAVSDSISTESLRLATTTNVVLTPLPSLSSPTKSCFRSPLKTPSAGPAGLSSSNLSPSKGVTWVSSSPTPESPDVEPLSATTWSKDHWRLLDKILETWKPENNISPLPSDGKESSARRRRNSTRVISRLLGKTVFSGEYEMKLEQWHLEAVDEFRGCVPGWQEKIIAMRLFALLVGEERRAKGLVGGGKSGNHHHLN